MPSQAKLVQLSCVRQSLHSEPEVCNVYARYLSSLCMYAYAGWCTALLVLACSLFSTISSQGLLDWGLLEHRTSPMVRNSNDKAMHKECLHYAYFSVYKTCGYLRLAQEAAEASMQEAVDEVRSLPDYSERGEVRLIVSLVVIVWVRTTGSTQEVWRKLNHTRGAKTVRTVVTSIQCWYLRGPPVHMRLAEIYLFYKCHITCMMYLSML